MKQAQIQITKSWRKSLSMRFDKHGVLQVKAPKFLLGPQIQSFISKNQAWIDKEFSKLQERSENKQWYLFGEKMESQTALPNPLLPAPSRQAHHNSSPLGEKMRSQTDKKMQPLSPPKEKGFRIEGVVGGDYEDKGKIEHFYKQQAKAYILPRCNELAEKYGFTHKGIRITSASTRWGSCSSKKTLNFSYRLIMSPVECIDYVIIHELCHLRQMNHSAKFWKEVADIMPDYKIHENHLKKEGWRYRM